MDFAADRNVWNVGNQFMLGPSLLVSPVYNYKAISRSIYLPAGQGWYEMYTGKYFVGGQSITAEAPYERVPVFIREGSIIPTGPELQYAAEKPADPITLFVYTGKDASFVLYEDEGLNYNYEQGKYTEIPFTYNEAAQTLTIGERTGNFEGMLKNRTVYIRVISKTNPAPIEFTVSRKDKKVIYKGKKLTIKI